MRHWIWCDIDQKIPILTSTLPRSILVFSGRYHIISNASLVNNCIMYYTPPHYYPVNCSSYKHVFTSRMENNVDSDQLASLEASWSGSTVFSKMDKSRFSRNRVHMGKKITGSSNIPYQVIFLENWAIRPKSWCWECQPINQLTEIFGPISWPDRDTPISRGSQPEKGSSDAYILVLKRNKFIDSYLIKFTLVNQIDYYWF